MSTHIVQQGEHISGIASKYGFVDYLAIWNHPANASLRKQRDNPHVLNPGDEVEIPPKKAKSVPIATGSSHQFICAATSLKLRLQVQDWNGNAIAKAPGTLIVEGQTYQLTTDAQGVLFQEVPADAQKGKLKIRGMEMDLLIGHLDPVDQLSGWRARLNNLGYNAGDAETEDNKKLRSAIEQFQHDQGLVRDASCGPATQAALLKAHGT